MPLGLEIVALAAAAWITVIALLGQAAGRFSGTDFWRHLLPFAGTVLALALLYAGAIAFWLRARAWLAGQHRLLPMTLSLAVASAAAGYAAQAGFARQMENLMVLMGGPAEAERVTLAHQVFAAYRRSNLHQLQRVLERAQSYWPIIEEAAATFDLDAEVLIGVASTESSFQPRDSKDGGRGLFQITAVPQTAIDLAQRRLGTATLDLSDPRHNAFVGAATLQHYLKQMHGDLFLGLLAYNIGPRNGGLRSIMAQYGARDFVTIQPYLQNLPRDYPIRVLRSALAFRVWRAEGRLPKYEEGDNARKIQGLGIPGMRGSLSLAADFPGAP
ncbi:MAG TPA: transglycosylase SLT domain-containing protein [Methylococcus sp.]|nr:transglycosylase SLT domain-containing protein [Methylococcus sp.]